MSKSEFDPVESIPPPEDVRRLLAEAIRRSDLLRALLRLSHRKAAYCPAKPSGSPLTTETITATAIRR